MKAVGTFTVANDPGPADVVLTKSGFDWRAQGFLPGQTVTIYDYTGGTKGAVLSTFKVLAITDDNPLDTFDNTELRLDQLTGAAFALGNRLVRLEAADDPVMVTLPVTFFGTPDIEGSDINEGGGTITRVGGDWDADGFEKGQLLLVDGLEGTWRIIDVTATVMTVRGTKESDGPGRMLPNVNGVQTLSVAGLHGGLTVIHGGGDFARELAPELNLGANFIERRDGLDWQDDDYAVGNFVTIEGLAGVWQITGFAQVPLANLSADIITNPFKGAGTNGRMLLAGSPIAAAVNVQHQVAVVEPFKAEAIGTMSITTSNLEVDPSNYSTITRAAGNWVTDGFYLGQIVYVSGLAGGFTVSNLTATAMRLQNVALTPQSGVVLDVFGYDLRGPGARATGLVRMGGDTITVGHSETATFSVNVDAGHNWLTRTDAAWDPDFYRVGQQIQIAGVDATFSISKISDSDGISLNGNDHKRLELTRTAGGGTLTAGTSTKTLYFAGIAGPDSPLVVYGDTSQDGVWYSGHPYDVLGYDFGEKPFDPFPTLPDGENEDDEWVFALANPYDYAGQRHHRRARPVRRRLGRPSADRRLHGLRRRGQRPDHRQPGRRPPGRRLGRRRRSAACAASTTSTATPASTSNVLTRALTISTVDASPRPTLDPTTS